MSRFVKVGDYVQISPVSSLFSSNIYLIKSITTSPSSVTITIEHIENHSDVQTLLINTSNKITIIGRTKPVQLRFESDLEEFQKHRSSRQMRPGHAQFAMTGIKPIDMNILLQMDDETLISACQVDKYISSLYKDDTLWINRITEYYPGAEQFKEDDTSWKEYYFQVTSSMTDYEPANRSAIEGYLGVVKMVDIR